jgi:hypothetical protein
VFFCQITGFMPGFKIRPAGRREEKGRSEGGVRETVGGPGPLGLDGSRERQGTGEIWELLRCLNCLLIYLIPSSFYCPVKIVLKQEQDVPQGGRPPETNICD